MKIAIVSFTTAFIMLISSVVFAQYMIVDFEPAGVGADWNWTVGENGDNPPLEFIANPVSGGINTSPTVAQFTARSSGQSWALCFTSDIDPFIFDTSNTIVKIMVYKPVISNVGIKFEGVSAPAEILIPNSVINQWEELTFDFSAFIGNNYNLMVIIPDFAPRDQDNLIYFDNIQIPSENTTPPAEPTEPAPTPTVDPAYVISLFSNAYDDVHVDTWSAEWDDADVTDIQIEGVDTKLYTNLVYAGIEFVSQTIDATGMTHFHMDIWTPDPTDLPAVFKIKLVDFGADGVWGGGDDVEHELTFDATTTPPLVSESWISFDIPLSDFVNLTTTGHLAQLIISGDPNTVYVDNVYFYNYSTPPGSDATLSDLKLDGVTIEGFSPFTQNYIYGMQEGIVVIPQITEVTTTDPNATYEITQASTIPDAASVLVTAQDGITTITYTVSFVIMYPNSVPPIPSHAPENVISLFSDAYIDVPVDTWLTPWSDGVLEEVEIAGNPVKKYTLVNYVGIETVGPNLIDVSDMTHLHIDLWTPDANDFKLKLVDWGADGNWSGGDDTEHELIYPTPATGQWISYDIPLSDFINLDITGHMAQYILSKPPLGTMYIDNLYFYAISLDIPANVTIIATTNEVIISWDPVPGATSYTVYSSDDPYGTYEPVSDGVYENTSWTSSNTGSAKFYYVTANSD
ncbi:MAG: hypothetical protein K0B81_02960 [Candidatus Cloacimonetes bacterium]|nr:hypothetical protein [Candidatus Cloacimonadota bacterium]